MPVSKFPAELSLHPKEQRNVEGVTGYEEIWIPKGGTGELRRFTLPDDAEVTQEEGVSSLRIRYQDFVKSRTVMQRLFGETYPEKTYAHRTAPLGGEKGMDVAAIMPRARQAILMWANAAGVELTAAAIESFLRDRESVELLGEEKRGPYLIVPKLLEEKRREPLQETSLLATTPQFPRDRLQGTNLILGENPEQRLVLWVPGKHTGQWERLRVDDNPEVLQFSDDGNVVGLHVLTSQWRKQPWNPLRRFLQKMQGNVTIEFEDENHQEDRKSALRRIRHKLAHAYVIPDNIPQADGSRTSVEQVGTDGRSGILAWTQNAVPFTPELIEELFPRNAGYTALNTGGNLCLILGKSERKRKYKKVTPPPAEEPLVLDKNVDLEQRLVEEIQKKFPYHMPLAQYQEEAHPKGFERLEMEEGRRAITALREAETMGIAHTEIYMPERAVGVVSLICENPIQAGGAGDHWNAMTRNLFLLMHCLRRHGRSAHILVGGVPHDLILGEPNSQSPSRGIFVNDVLVGSEQGQDLLCRDPAKLSELLRQFQVAKGQPARFASLLSPDQFPNLRGLERPSSQEEASQLSALLHQYFLIRRLLPESGTGATHTAAPEEVQINGETFRTDDLIRNCKQALRIMRKMGKIQSDREKRVVELTKDLVSSDIPHAVVSSGQKHGLLKKFAAEGYGVLVTTPSDLRSSDSMEDNSLTFDKQTQNYRSIENLLYLLETMTRKTQGDTLTTGKEAVPDIAEERGSLRIGQFEDGTPYIFRYHGNNAKSEEILSDMEDVLEMGMAQLSPEAKRKRAVELRRIDELFSLVEEGFDLSKPIDSATQEDIDAEIAKYAASLMNAGTPSATEK